MKKTVCILLILCLLCGCGSKPKPEPSPAPLPEIMGEPQPAAEPEAEPAPEPEAEAAPEAEAEAAPEAEPQEPADPDYEHEPSWDSAEPAPDPEPTQEYEPVEMLSTFSDAQRTDLNVFLSNFSELNFPNFKRDSYDESTVVNFAYMHNKINSFGRNKIDVRQWNGESCYSISVADVDACLERFLGIRAAREEFEMDMHQIGCDGERYYFPAADGEAFNTFSIATAMNRTADGSCYVTFDIYDLDYEVYWDTGLSDEYYAMTPAQAEASPVLTRSGSGEALLEDYVNNGNATWRLLYYYLTPES